jgi:hypothetical protein
MAQAAVLTKTGRNVLLAAMTAGTTVNITTAIITDQVLACSGDETSLPTNVFRMTTPQLLIYSPGPNVLRFALPMDATIGTFTIGTIGLFDSNSNLIALASFPGAGSKIANSLPNTLGNIRTFYIDIGYDDISATVNPLTITVAPSVNALVSALIYG